MSFAGQNQHLGSQMEGSKTDATPWVSSSPRTSLSSIPEYPMNFCALSKRCQKEHLACPSINEIITGTRLYNFDCDLVEDLPPSYEEVLKLDAKLLPSANNTTTTNNNFPQQHNRAMSAL